MLKIRGKFFFEEQNKIYLSQKNCPRVSFAEFQLSAKKIEGFVIVELGIDKLLGDLFRKTPNAEAEWMQALKRVAYALKDQPRVIAIDLGAPLSISLKRAMPQRAIRKISKKAINAIRKADPDRLVTWTSHLNDLNLDDLDFLSVQIGPDALEPSLLTHFRTSLAKAQILADGLPVVARFETRDVKFSVQDLRTTVDLAHLAGCAGIYFETDIEDLKATAAQECSVDPFGNRLGQLARADALPLVSVVVCVCNGEETIEECLDGAAKIKYPNFEVIVIDDGSTDRTLELARAKSNLYSFRVESLGRNEGLSFARNRGLSRARGEIVAYLDSDAFPEEDWLNYLVSSFLTTKFAVIGGPNLNPLHAFESSDWVDKAPGNPLVVMIDSEAADHIPGCNLAVRRDFMRAIGGFDLRYRGGGDDVNFCWKVIEQGGTMGYSPGAMVWHYRRPTIRKFLKQQRGYGKGEAALERDWPERFNSLGHQVANFENGGRARIYQNAIFSQNLRELLVVLPQMPEWPFLCLAGLAVSSIGVVYSSFGWLAIPALVGLGIWLAQAAKSALRARLRKPTIKGRMALLYLYLAQPIVRVEGRIRAGMAPWKSRFRNQSEYNFSAIDSIEFDFRLSNEIHERIRKLAKIHQLALGFGSAEQDFDWEIEGGAFGKTRVMANVEKTRAHFKKKLMPTLVSRALGIFTIGLLTIAIFESSLILIAVFVLALMALTAACFRQAGQAAAAFKQIIFDPELVRREVWSDFAPPRHFFQSLPVQKTSEQSFVKDVQVEADLLPEGIYVH